MSDQRVVNGARCSWWGLIAEASAKIGVGGSMGLPCCPHCGGVLFETASREDWYAAVDSYAARSGDVRYRPFIDWVRGRCFPSVTHARSVYNGIWDQLDPLTKENETP